MAKALVVVVLGVWMMISPAVIPSPAVASWNSWIVGVLGVLSGLRFARDHRTWQAGLTFIASACIFVAGFIPRLQAGDQLIGRSLIFGALLFVAGVSSFGHHHEEVRPASPRLN